MATPILTGTAPAPAAQPATLAADLHALLQPMAVVDSLLYALACTARHQAGAGLGSFDGFDLVNLAELARRELLAVRDELDELVTVAGGAA